MNVAWPGLFVEWMEKGMMFLLDLFGEVVSTSSQHKGQIYLERSEREEDERQKEAGDGWPLGKPSI